MTGYTDGLAPTLKAVRSKMDQPLPMGYFIVGPELERGPAAIGEQVASNGNHAEMVCTLATLWAKVPEADTRLQAEAL